MTTKKTAESRPQMQENFDFAKIAHEFIHKFHLDFGKNDSLLSITEITSGASISMFGYIACYITLRGRGNDRNPYLKVANDELKKAGLTEQQLPPCIVGEDMYQTHYFNLDCNLDCVVTALYNYAKKYYSSEIFGCCSKYIQCSDARQCIVNDLAISINCAYFKNLQAGRIFYGKNRNID
ncbi:MAG TPA: hypothetical protein IAB00_00940 [Candidatus Avidehalobacter gallistercoris]|uniref:Uncharacterized protein n=1 Tax=Candidatus Avidehalobacter gallistercoris TaxID=2840694 RepID=A0A9D1KYX7_9FIRM|nr:hypothetical protein [Candidatus Avidehalobacter gallistercoris]